MNKTTVVFSPIFYRHNPGRGHPESAKRLHAIVQELKSSTGSDRNWRLVQPERARIEDVELVHGTEYIRMVEAVSKSGGGLLDLQDTVVSPESFEVALYAVGGTLKAVNLVLEKKFENAFALVRPPGHHAARFRALGFCLFNNIAIAAQHLVERLNLKRVAILDVDAHHGNGTQEIFYGTDKVLYVSLHEDPSEFPGTGYTDEIGEEKGIGYTVNVPLPFGTGDRVYLKAMREIVDPIVRQYRPQFMLLSAGFDTHYADPVGRLALSGSGISRVYRSMADLATEVCQGRFVAVLEGGYNVRVVGRLVVAAIAHMSSTRYSVTDKSTRVSSKAESNGIRVIEEVKKTQRAFWSL